MKYLETFRENHQITAGADLTDIEVSVECVSEANELAYEYLANIDNKTNKDGFIMHTHLNLLGRVHEQAEGMLACIANRCPTSSEALGRIVVEGSINLMFLSVLGDERHILSFFNRWIVEHKRKLEEWRLKVEGKAYMQEIQSMIDDRLSALENYKYYVDFVIKNLSVDVMNLPKYWPKSLYNRFESLGLEESYYTIYHRLSGSSHITAEDTISWMMFLNQSNEQRRSLAIEAWSYSIMMSRIVSLTFIEGVMGCCQAHGLKDNRTLQRFNELKQYLAQAVSEISESAGVPNDNNPRQ